jgi:hypothetical protein
MIEDYIDKFVRRVSSSSEVKLKIVRILMKLMGTQLFSMLILSYFIVFSSKDLSRFFILSDLLIGVSFSITTSLVYILKFQRLKETEKGEKTEKGVERRK